MSGKPYDPFEGSEFQVLLRISRSMAGRFGLDSGDGEDALQTVLRRIHASQRSVVTSQNYVLKGVRNELLSTLRETKRRNEVGIPDESAWVEDPGSDLNRGEREAWLAACRGLSALERLIQLEELSRLPQALETLTPNEGLAWSARLRQSLEDPKLDLVEVLRETSGVDLGEHSGTAALAEAIDRPPGTVANLAFRGQGKLDEFFGVQRRPPRPTADERRDRSRVPPSRNTKGSRRGK